MLIQGVKVTSGDASMIPEMGGKAWEDSRHEKHTHVLPLNYDHSWTSAEEQISTVVSHRSTVLVQPGFTRNLIIWACILFSKFYQNAAF